LCGIIIYFYTTMRKEHQTFRIHPEWKKKAVKQAEKEHRKVCQLYEVAVIEYLEKKVK